MKTMLVYLVLNVVAGTAVYSQFGGHGGSFLERGASPVVMSMGDAGVALPVNDATSVVYNPANLGMNIRENNFLITYNYNANSMYNNNDLLFSNYGINFGYELDSLIDIPINAGVSFIRRSADYHNFVRTDETGQVLGRYNSQEWSNELTLAASFLYYAAFSFGVTYKSIGYDQNEIENGNITKASYTGNTNAFDFGVNIKIPVVKDHKLTGRMSFDVSAAVGLAGLNFGGELNYPDASVPLTRLGSLGYSVSSVLNYKKQDFEISLLGIDWSVAAVSNLAVYDTAGISYEGIFKRMDIHDNILRLNTTDHVKSLYGFRISLLELFYLSFGWTYFYHEDNSTAGFGITSKGIAKVIYQLTDSEFFRYFNEYITFSYTNAKISNPFDNTSFNLSSGNHLRFHGFNIMIKL